MVRALKTDSEKKTSALIALLVPLGCVAHYHALQWVEDRFVKTGNAVPSEKLQSQLEANSSDEGSNWNQ